MSNPVKLIIGVCSIGGVAGGAYLLNQHLSTKETIAKKLEKNKYQILEDYSNAEWTKIFAQYQLVEKENNNQFKFQVPTIATKEQLQEQCKLILAKTYTEEAVLKRAKKWCTVPKTLKEVLKDKGYLALNTEDDKDTETQAKWDPKIELHNKKQENKSKRFNNLNGSDDNSVNKDKDGRNKIRKACRDLEGKKHYEKDFENNLDQSILWCTKTKSESN